MNIWQLILEGLAGACFGVSGYIVAGISGAPKVLAIIIGVVVGAITVSWLLFGLKELNE